MNKKFVVIFLAAILMFSACSSQEVVNITEYYFTNQDTSLETTTTTEKSFEIVPPVTTETYKDTIPETCTELETIQQTTYEASTTEAASEPGEITVETISETYLASAVKEIPKYSTGIYKGAISINEPKSPKTKTLGNSKITLDISNTSKGYITCTYKGGKAKTKLLIIKGNVTYQYVIKTDGSMEIFPLQMGNGEYKFRLMENIGNDNYIQLFSSSCTVKLENEFSPFLYPNQFVDYNSKSTAVKKSYDVCMNAKTDVDKVSAIYNFIADTVTYDKVKAKNVQLGYLPKVDETLSTKKGICFDYAALMVAMLRAQNVPAKLAIGTVAPKNLSHSWVDVYIKNKGWVTIKIEADGSEWKRLDPTFAAAGASDISEFIGNGSNYLTTRIY